VRASFLILLLANILLLAWSLWVAQPASSALAPAPAADPGSMQLASEVAKQRDSAAQPLPSGREARAAAATCVSFGPFTDDTSLAAASERLQSLGYTARERAASEDVPSGQWVSVTDLATPEDAANALNALRAVGLTDVFVVTDAAPGTTTISVGVFNDPVRAGEVADTVRRGGLEPRVTARTRTADVTWLDVDRRSNQGLPDLADLHDDDGAAAGFEMRACPAAG
jgi:hypothetical protein